VIFHDFAANPFSFGPTFRQEVDVVFWSLFSNDVDVVVAEYKVAAGSRSGVHDGKGTRRQDGEETQA